MSALLTIDGLRKEFKLKDSKESLIACDDVSFQIEQSQTYGLIGESGSGKTTVGRMLLRLIEPTAGRLAFNGNEYQNLKPKAFHPILRQMQMVFQDPYYSLNTSRTIWHAVSNACHEREPEKSLQVKQAFERVQIAPDLFDKYPHQMSMGQQQRVGIARAIVSNPKFIVLDEPTSSLDLTIRGEIMGLLLKLQEELKISFLFISHDLSTIRHMCHKVSIMYLGQIVESGNVEQVFEKSAHPYSTALLASVMHPDPKIKRRAYALKGEIPSPINLPCACYLAKRCPEAKDVCFHQRPGMKEVGPGHFVRCHLR